MKPGTKKLLLLGGVVAGFVALDRALKPKRKPTKAAPVSTVVAELKVLQTQPVELWRGIPIAVEVSEPPLVTAAPEPAGGWRAYATTSAVDAAARACSGEADIVACALSRLFQNVEWPPARGAAPWQQEAYAEVFPPAT